MLYIINRQKYFQTKSQSQKKILKIAKNPYYLTLRLSANISKKSSAHNFLNIHLIFRVMVDMPNKIKWSNFGENRIISKVLNKY